MLVNTKEVTQGILAVKQAREKALGVSIQKGHLVLRGWLEPAGFTLIWQQALTGGVADEDERLLEHNILAGIIRSAPGEANMELSEQGIHVWTDNAYWKLEALGALNGSGDQPPESLPVGGKIKLRFDIPISQFREIVKIISKSASDDGTHPILQAVLIAHDAQLVACTTDAYRLRVLPIDEYCTKRGIDIGDWTQIEILSVAALKAAANAVSKLPKNCTSPIRLQLRSKAWTISCGPIRLTAGYLSDQYPDVSKVIPSHKDATWTLTVDADELRTALTRLAPIAALDGNRVVFDWQGDNKIILKADDHHDDHHSEAEVCLPCNVKCKGKRKDWSTAFNCLYLLDGIAGRDGEITLEQSSPLEPILLDFEADGLYVLMPMMVM